MTNSLLRPRLPVDPGRQPLGGPLHRRAAMEEGQARPGMRNKCQFYCAQTSSPWVLRTSVYLSIFFSTFFSACFRSLCGVETVSGQWLLPGATLTPVAPFHYPHSRLGLWQSPCGATRAITLGDTDSPGWRSPGLWCVPTPHPQPVLTMSCFFFR